MRILIGCEESDEVRGRFEKLGFDAWSCDILPNRSNTPKHLQTDIFEIINLKWDVLIAFPPCTHLASSGAAWFEQKRKDGRQKQGIDFFMKLVSAPIKHIVIENPVGIMSRLYRRPDQIIHPYYFGDAASKSTCLWLKNLPLLYHNKSINLFDQVVTHCNKGNFFISQSGKKYNDWLWKTGGGTGQIRSKTFPGIAEAMATQWGEYLLNIGG